MTTPSYDVPRGVPLLVAVVALILAGCGSDQSAAGHRRDLPPAAVPPSAARARAQLDRLVVTARPRGTEGYVRAAFGDSWVDTDHDGCNQRDDVLLRDAVRGTTQVQQQGACDHDVLAGTWHDPYTGRTLVFTDLKDLHQAEAIQIDHVVPLAEAWVSGARSWSKERRELFANDLGELLAVEGRPTRARATTTPPRGGRGRATSAPTRGAGSRSRRATTWRSTPPRRRPSTRCSGTAEAVRG